MKVRGATFLWLLKLLVSVFGEFNESREQRTTIRELLLLAEWMQTAGMTLLSCFLCVVTVTTASRLIFCGGRSAKNLALITKLPHLNTVFASIM
jgi:hypothetical protein